MFSFIFGDAAFVSKAKVYDWFQNDRDGDGVGDDLRPGCLSTPTTDKNVKKLKKKSTNQRGLCVMMSA